MKALFPALALFAAAALGLFAWRDAMTDESQAKPAVVEVSEEDAAIPQISSSQIRTASLRKEGDGHYWATARVNGVTVKFLVDTGASLVSLNQRDARRIGLDLENLQRNVNVSTASGKTRGSAAVIEEISIDGVELEDVTAVVIDDGLEYSLLGMSFLNRLDSWAVTPNAIIIHE